VEALNKEGAIVDAEVNTAPLIKLSTPLTILHLLTVILLTLMAKLL
jgi:hypothetical protein